MKKQLGIGLAALVASALMLAAPVTAQEYANNEETFNLLMQEGETGYANNCAACHGATGAGGGGPSLIGSNVVQSRSAVIYQVLFGAMDHGMPAYEAILSDEEIAAITTYIRNSWDNDYGIVLPRSVEMRRTVPPAEGQ